VPRPGILRPGVAQADHQIDRHQGARTAT
jgi:hypothetical protein